MLTHSALNSDLIKLKRGGKILHIQPLPPHLISFIISRPDPKIINEISSIFPAPCIHSSHRTLPLTMELLKVFTILGNIAALCITRHCVHCVRAWEPLSLPTPGRPSLTRSQIWSNSLRARQLKSDRALRRRSPSEYCGECGLAMKSGHWAYVGRVVNTRGAGLLTTHGDTDLAMEDTSDTSGDQLPLLCPQITAA